MSRTCHIFGGDAVVDIVVVSEQVLLLAGERGRAVLRLGVLVLVPGPRAHRGYYTQGTPAQGRCLFRNQVE